MQKLVIKKLLLLNLLPLSVIVTSFAGKAQYSETNYPTLNDSLIRTEVLANPREGFKNLFESSGNATASFAAKLNPQAISFVEDYMERNNSKLTKMKSWGRPYFDMMDNVLAKHGLPEELKYLSVIESDLSTEAVSWAGAVGPWQFMPETARLMGLRVSKNVDERKDMKKSTYAAARYLTQLYRIYNDWLLVIAAYNCGPGNVNSAIRRSGSRNFWSLQYHLPTESRNHVKKFIATHYIMEGSGGLTTMTKSETANMPDAELVQPAATAEMETIPVTGKYNSLVIAQKLHMNITEFNKMNPGFDKQMASNGSYSLRLPSDKAMLFQAHKPQILEQSIRLILSGASQTL
jgi:membrane-bound lytic murein transglycosylase D